VIVVVRCSGGNNRHPLRARGARHLDQVQCIVRRVIPMLSELFTQEIKDGARSVEGDGLKDAGV